MNRPLYFEYPVQIGDTLPALIQSVYGSSPPSRHHEEVLQTLQALNPHLRTNQPLQPGMILRLSDCVPAHVPGGVRPLWLESVRDRSEQRALWALAWAQHSNLLLAPGGVALGATSTLMSPGNLDLLRRIGDDYALYKRGQLTKGQYDHRRRAAIQAFASNVGPAERWLFQGARTQEAMRIARRGGVPYDHHMQQHLGHLRALSRLAGAGGIVLGGVGVTAACLQIAHALDAREKNEVFVETVASTVVGTGFGLVVGLVLISNPVGWGTAIALAIGSTAISSFAGWGAKQFYTLSGARVDLVGGSGVSELCR
jgi:hypothetical protein